MSDDNVFYMSLGLFAVVVLGGGTYSVIDHSRRVKQQTAKMKGVHNPAGVAEAVAIQSGLTGDELVCFREGFVAAVTDRLSNKRTVNPYGTNKVFERLWYSGYNFGTTYFFTH